MAMRSDVKRRALVLIVFAIVQFLIVHAALTYNWWPQLDKNGRILTFFLSAFGGSWILMGSILYMVFKGRIREDDEK